MRSTLSTTLSKSLQYLFFLCAFLLSSSANAQCPLSSFNEGGTVTPNACPGFQQVSVGSGTYVTANVHNGGIYDFGLCNAANWADDQLTGYQVGSGVLFYNDNNGPLCG